MENTGFVYALICPESQEIRYIGQTIQKLKRRLQKHIFDTNSKVKKHLHLNHKNAWIRGLIIRNTINELKIELIETTDIELLNEREVYWIAYYRNEGYDLTNCTTGGNQNTKMSEETRKRIGESKKGNKFMVGKKHSDATKKLLSDMLKGENHPLFGTNRSDDTKKKIGDANKGEKNGMFGKKVEYNPEVAEKISNALKNSKVFQDSRKSDEYGKKISDIQSTPLYLLDINRNVIAEFNNCREVSEHLGCTKGNVKNARRDNRMLCKKYWVIYKDEFKQQI